LPTLVITRGLPGCGKTTYARAWVAEDPATRARCNRDDFRDMLHASRGRGDRAERQVTAAQHAAVSALLARGVDVIVDDMNLRSRYARDLRALASRTGAEFAVMDLTDVPVDVCVARDAQRPAPAHVGEDVIRGLYDRYVRGRSHPLPLPDEPVVAGGTPVQYEPPAGGIRAALVDIDGTVAVMCDRSPYDETRVGEDAPNVPVVAAVRALANAGYAIVFLSGRTEGCRPATEKWLGEHLALPYSGLFMRPIGDTRKDSIVKLELFDRHVRFRYDVALVLDDRRQVVDAWRAIGLTVFQVAPGDF
jgi:predicted kinase